MKKNLKATDVTKLLQVQLIDEIIVRMQEKKLSEESIKAVTPFIKELAERNGLSNDAAMLFAAFFDNFSDAHILVRDIAHFYDCNQVKILTKWTAIEELVARRFVVQYKKSDGDVHYSVPMEVVVAMRENNIYSPAANADLTMNQWLSALSKLLNNKTNDKIPYENFADDLRVLIDSNQHLLIARELSTIKDEDDLIIFTGMMDLYIKDHDNHIMKHDLEDLFDNPWQMRMQARLLEKGVHPLQIAGLVEQTDCNGQVEANAWRLTDDAKERFLADVDCSAPVENDKSVQKAESITEKPLFFNDSVSKQMAQLESLLQEDRFAAVQENLVKHGMRRGFACIFYGAPGTGKTESVLQLARKTGRGIMMVDVPSLRDKYVGETEKNTKAIFDKYRKFCKNSKLAPILLFNEADAVLCKRNEGATGSVDKMENAMQNIILQEMENLEGIMIATTNLTGNLDTAFERR